VDFALQLVPDLMYPATVAVFTPQGDATLSDNTAWPGEFITISSNALLANNTAEIVFLNTSGDTSRVVLANVPEDGSVSVGVPALFNSEGELLAQSVTVSVDGVPASGTLFVQPPLSLDFQTGGLVWLANQYESLEALREALNHLDAISSESGDDLYDQAVDLGLEITALETSISEFESSGVIRVETGDGIQVELSGDDLDQLDNLLLHRITGITALLDRVEGVAVASAASPNQIGTAHLHTIDDFLRPWRELNERFENAPPLGSPETPLGAALDYVRQRLPSMTDLQERAATLTNSGAEGLAQRLATTLSQEADAGNRPARVAGLALAEFNTTFRGHWAEVTRSSIRTLTPDVNDADAHSSSLELLVQLTLLAAEWRAEERQAYLERAKGAYDLLEKTQMLLNDLYESACPYLVRPYGTFCQEVDIPLTGEALLESLNIMLSPGMSAIEGEDAYRVTRCEVTPEVNRNPVYILVEDRSACSDPWGPYGGRKSGVGEYCAWCPSGTYWRSGIGCCFDE
jgi:hypothetical protein